MNSEQSQRLETGSIVIRYTSAAMAKTGQAKRSGRKHGTETG